MANLDIQVENNADGSATLRVAVDDGLFQKTYLQVCQKYGRRLRLAGFRKGSYPPDLVENSVGREALVNQTISDLGPKLVKQALDQADLEWVGTPRVDRCGEDEPVVLEVKVALAPTAELADYADIKLDAETEADKSVAIDEQVEKTLESIRRSQGKWEPVNDAARMEDLILLGADGYIEDEPFLSWKKEELILNAENKTPMLGFHQQIEGLHRGAQHEFKLTVPDDFVKADKAGKTASFKVVIKRVSRLILPELNDEFAAQLKQPNVSNLADLRGAIKSNVAERMQADQSKTRVDNLLERLVELSRFKIAAMTIEDEIADLVEEQQREVARYRVEWDAYLKHVGKSEEDLRAELKSVAETRIKRSVALEELVKREKPEVADAEVQAELAKLQADPQYAKIKRWSRVEARIRSNMEERKALESALAKVEQSSSAD